MIRELQGCLDHVSRTNIVGWVVDQNAVERPVDISIFLDGQKFTQFCCDGFDENANRHDFEISFDSNVIGVQPVRVTARFTETGQLLENGDQLLRPDAQQAPSDLGVDLPEGFPPLPSPDTPRGWFERLVLYESKDGLFDLVARCDFRNRTQAQIAYSVLGVERRRVDRARRWGPGEARDAAFDTLMSRAFQERCIDLLVTAFPEKRRRFFIHIPKCAGSDFSYHLTCHFPSIHEQMTKCAYTSKETLFEGLGRLVRMLPFFDAVVAHGHFNLGVCADRGLIRPIDDVITILRYPVAIAVSQVNYVLTRLDEDAETGSFGPDIPGWLDALGLELQPSDINRDLLRDLRFHILREPRVATPNVMCDALGGGTVAEVIEHLHRHRAEVTTLPRYNRWLAERWGVEQSTQINESIKFLTMAELSADDRDYLYHATEADRELYTHFTNLIDRSGASFVRCGAIRPGQT